MAQALGDEEGVLIWRGAGMDVNEIESEFVRLRYAGPDEEPVAVRASLFNLIVYAENEEAAREAGKALAAMPRRHPSRSVIVTGRGGDGESEIRALLSVHCHRPPGLERQVCCEEIRLTVSGRAAEHLHGVVMPLLVPDLPVFLWWMGDLPEDQHTLEELTETADRLIVDSAQSTEPSRQLRALEALCRDRDFCAIGDLNWVRLEPWRRLLMQQQGVMDLRRCLERFSSLEIVLADGAAGMASGPAQLCLLLGWLSARFGWLDSPPLQSPSDPDGVFSILTDGGEAAAKVRRDERYTDLPSGSLVSLRLSGEGQEGCGAISIALTDDLQHLKVHIEEVQATIEGNIRVDNRDQGRMLAAELDLLGRDEEFEEALRRSLLFLPLRI